MYYPLTDWPILATLAMFAVLIGTLAYGSWVTRDVDLLAFRFPPEETPETARTVEKEE